MPERNSKHLNTVYIKAEELFQKLSEVKTAYLPWTVLGTIDLQAYIEQNFKTVDDWENNFQMLKAKRKELKKLPDSVKVDCINVNLVPFKSGVEDIFKRLSDALVETLQTSIEKDAEEVFKFIKAGLAKLNSNP
jgi:dynein heavy chain 2, cytosolic